MNCVELENVLVEKGLTAPRITPADVEGSIRSEWYFTAAEGVVGVQALINEGQVLDIEDPYHVVQHPELGLLTFCVLILNNGYTVYGTSACASPENFDAEVGQQVARRNAVEQIWPLLGFELRNKLSAAQN